MTKHQFRRNWNQNTDWINYLNFHTQIIKLRFMAKFSKRILTIATYTFVITFISLIIGFLSKEDSFAQAIFDGIGLYGIIITFCILLFHLLIVLISFIVKAKFSKRILTIATYTFVITFISLIIGFLSKEGSFAQAIFDGIGLYGTIITFYILLFHLLIVLISFIVKIIKGQDNN